MRSIKLGDNVKCKHTGFKGVVVAKTEFINGCIQFSIVAKVNKENKYPEDVGIDEESLELVSRPKKATKKKTTNGGATRSRISMKGY